MVTVILLFVLENEFGLQSDSNTFVGTPGVCVNGFLCDLFENFKGHLRTVVGPCIFVKALDTDLILLQLVNVDFVRQIYLVVKLQIYLPLP